MINFVELKNKKKLIYIGEIFIYGIVFTYLGLLVSSLLKTIIPILVIGFLHW